MTATVLLPEPETRSVPRPSAGPRSIPMIRLMTLAVAGGAMFWMSFFPLDLGFLGWLAPVPLALMAAARVRPGRLFLASWLCGIAFFLPALQWLRVAHPMMYLTWVGLALYCSLFFPLAVFLTRALLRGGVSLPFSLAVVWVALEYVRGMFLGGFPWYFLAHSQHDYLALIQVADLGGAYLLSFVMALAAGLVASLVLRLGGWREWLGAPNPGRFPLVGLASTLALIVGTVGYGLWRLDHPPFPDGPRVALVQGNIPQEVKNSRSDPDGERARAAVYSMRDHHLELSLAASRVEPKPGLIVWPETSYPFPWLIRPDAKPEAMPEQGWEDMTAATDMATEHFGHFGTGHGAYVLLGLNSREFLSDAREVKYNSALLIAPSGEIPAVYHKMHRVPFGEFVPFRETLPFMKLFTPYDNVEYGIEPGLEYERFAIEIGGRDYTFGVLICYEDSDPTLARRYVGGGTGSDVNFLVNISNDGWFKGTEEHEQHLAISRFRAVEARRSLTRSVNMGISAVIDGDGRVVALPADDWGGSKKRAAVVDAVVPLDDRTSVYAMAGDWLPAGCGVVLLAGMVVGYWRRSDVA